MMNCTVRMDPENLRAVVKKGSRKALFKAAAFAMRMARQKIRFRKNKSSIPGQPPFKHRTGSNSFSHSIVFAVDHSGESAVIGPRREAKPADPDGPVPHVLEFGGRTTAGQNSLWFSKNAPEGLNSVDSIAAYFRSIGFGPLFMGPSPDSVIQSAGPASAAKLRKRRAPDFSRKSDGSYRLIYYVSTPIISDRQARRAAENVVRYFGLPASASSVIAPRPFMGPTLTENQDKISSFWKNII